MKKTFFVFTAAFCILFAAAFSAFAGELQPSGATIVLNEQPVVFDVPPMVRDGRTLVPMRAIFELLGADVAWYAETQTIAATKGDTSILLNINQPAAVVNGERIALDVAPVLYDGRTLVPLRFVSEKLNLDVAFDSDANRIVLRSMYENAEEADADYVYDNGNYYKGPLKNGLPNGYGVVYDRFGKLSEGDFVNGLRHGYGILYKEDGAKLFEGNFVNDHAQGYGILYYENGTKRYEGEFVDDKRNGKGILYFEDGSSCEGIYNDEMPLDGIYISRDLYGNVIGGIEYKNGEYVRNIDFVVFPIDGSAGTPSGQDSTGDDSFGGNASQGYMKSTEATFNTAKYPLHLFADDGTYLGKLVTSKYDSDSIYNPYGDYGSKYSKTSIFNTYGDYGSNYSNYSPYNRYATHPPKIVDDDGKLIGYLTVNTYHKKAISFETLVLQLQKHRQ